MADIIVPKETALQKLLEQRIVVLDDDINITQIEKIMRDMMLLILTNGKDPIKLIIDSNGGSVQASLNLYDFISTLPVSVNAYVMRKCHSAAAYPLLACKERSALTHARFIMHSMKSSFEVLLPHPFGLSIEEQFTKNLQDFKLNRDKVDSIYTAKLKVPIDEVIEKMKEGQRTGLGITTEEARRIGMITKVCNDPTKWFWNSLIPKATSST